MNDENSTQKAESEVFEDIGHCIECVLNNNLCKHHAYMIKKILTHNIQSQIRKLTIGS